jgi:hypothetical protein
MLFFEHSRRVSAVGLIEYQVVLFLVINTIRKRWFLPGSEVKDE